MSTIGDQIRVRLKYAHMTQANCARRMGISAQYLSDIMRGKRNLSAEVALKLEMVLGLSAIDWMMMDNNRRLAEARERVV